MTGLMETLREKIDSAQRQYETTYYGKLKGTADVDTIMKKHKDKMHMAQTIIGLLSCVDMNIKVMKESFKEVEKKREEKQEAVDQVVVLQKQLLEAKTTILAEVKESVEKSGQEFCCQRRS